MYLLVYFKKWKYCEVKQILCLPSGGAVEQKYFVKSRCVAFATLVSRWYQNTQQSFRNALEVSTWRNKDEFVVYKKRSLPLNSSI
jgi:hypothetical protein